MKTYKWHLVIIAICILFAHTMEYNELIEDECFTDACLCVDDCLSTVEEY